MVLFLQLAQDDRTAVRSGYGRHSQRGTDSRVTRKILVVDDDAAIRQSLRMILEGEGFMVLGAPDGRKALETVRSQQVDLVITDILMPEREGLETIRALRRDHGQVPIIAISGAPHLEYLDAAEQFGARRTFRKPFEVAAFVRAVHEVIGGTQQPV
jgi:CheY-like chemotaxis protein